MKKEVLGALRALLGVSIGIIIGVFMWAVFNIMFTPTPSYEEDLHFLMEIVETYDNDGNPIATFMFNQAVTYYVAHDNAEYKDPYYSDISVSIVNETSDTIWLEALTIRFIPYQPWLYASTGLIRSEGASMDTIPDIYFEIGDHTITLEYTLYSEEKSDGIQVRSLNIINGEVILGTPIIIKKIPHFGTE